MKITRKRVVASMYGDRLSEDYTDSGTEWKLLKTKRVTDFDGFYTDYSLWYNEFEDIYECILGDTDMYYPENAYPDAEFENYYEALDWYESASNFDEI